MLKMMMMMMMMMTAMLIHDEYKGSGDTQVMTKLLQLL